MQCKCSVECKCLNLLPLSASKQDISNSNHFRSRLAVRVTMLFNDLWRFDPISNIWTNLSALSQGSQPSERFGMGFTAGNGNLYVYGGTTREHLI